MGEITLLVIAGAIAALVHRLFKQPFGTPGLIDGNHRCEPGKPPAKAKAGSP